MKAKVIFTKQPWSGWTREQPGSEETELILEKGLRVEEVNGSSNPIVEVLDIMSDGIVLKTSNLAPMFEGGGLNLRQKFNDLKTTIKVGESAKFGTQTMDAGTNFIFLVKEIVY